MKSQKLKLVLFSMLAIYWTGCSFDKNEVRDEQQKRESQNKADHDAEVAQIVGTYEGFLTINEKSYEIIMTINNLGGSSLTTGATIGARIKRSDVILSEDAKLSGIYYPKGSSQLNNIKASNAIGELEISSVDIRWVGDHLIGTLSQPGGTLGTLDVVRTSRVLNLDLIDACDSFYKTVRPKVEEITGLYEFTRRPEGFAPMTQDLSIQAYRDLSLSVVTQADGFEGMTLSAFFVPYTGRGLLYLKTTSTGKELLTITLEKQNASNIVFSGSYISNTGRQGRAEIRKLSGAPKFCPDQPLPGRK